MAAARIYKVSPARVELMYSTLESGSSGGFKLVVKYWSAQPASVLAFADRRRHKAANMACVDLRDGRDKAKKPHPRDCRLTRSNA